MSTADGVVDVQDNLSANLEIEEARRVTSKQLNLPRDFSTGEEDKLDTISVTGQTSIIIDNPDEFDGFNNRDDLCGLLGRAEDDRARIGQTLKIDNFQGGSDEETSFSDNKLERSISIVACRDGAVVGRSIKSILRTTTNLSSTWAEAIKVTVNNCDDGEINLVRNCDGCLCGY